MVILPEGPKSLRLPRPGSGVDHHHLSSTGELPRINPSSWCCLSLEKVSFDYARPTSVFFFFFKGLCLWHMQVPRLGIESKLQLPATATAMPDLSKVCDLHHSSWQQQILNPLSKARDWICNLMVPSQIRFCCTTRGTPRFCFNWQNQKVLQHSVIDVWKSLSITS